MKKPIKRFTFEERKQIQQCLQEGLTATAIAEKLGRCKSSVAREIRFCSDGVFDRNNYTAEKSQKKSQDYTHLIDKDFIGKKIHHLTVISYEGYNNSKKRRTLWKCLCDCGAICYFSKKMLSDYCSTRRPLSCGCVAKQNKQGNKNVPIEESSLRKYQDILFFREIVDDCWIYKGYCQKGLIPKTSWKNKVISVRRCIYIILNGESSLLPPIYASCGNRLCFNPDHATLKKPMHRSY